MVVRTRGGQQRDGDGPSSASSSNDDDDDNEMTAAAILRATTETTETEEVSSSSEGDGEDADAEAENATSGVARTSKENHRGSTDVSKNSEKRLVSNKVSTATTVRLNVGGQLHEFSRSLLDRYPNSMLARMMDDHWQHPAAAAIDDNNDDDNDGVLFIDRNGARFGYVLDLLRDGQIHLPVTVSRAALQMDLDFFGLLDDAAPPVIQQSSLLEATEVLASLEEDVEAELQALDGSILQKKCEIEVLDHKKAAITTADAIFKRCGGSGCQWSSGAAGRDHTAQRTTVRMKQDKHGTAAFLSHRHAQAALKVQDFLTDRLRHAYGLVLVDGSETADWKNDDYYCSFVVERCVGSGSAGTTKG